MNGFRLGQRVLVRKCGHEGEFDLPEGTCGVVRRLLSSSEAAWVYLDGRLTGDLERAHPFEADDNRATSVLTWPELCDPFTGQRNYDADGTGR